MIRFAVALAIGLAIAAPASAGEWRTYTNERFGTTADVPAGWRENPPPANGDGLSFTSPDGAATVAVYGGFQAFDTLAEMFHERPMSWFFITMALVMTFGAVLLIRFDV